MNSSSTLAIKVRHFRLCCEIYVIFAAKREQVWSDVASAAETGWDFSTRWFAQSGSDAGQMRSIRTWKIVPVDLNAFMCSNSRMMASMYELTGARYFLHFFFTQTYSQEICPKCSSFNDASSSAKSKCTICTGMKQMAYGERLLRFFSLFAIFTGTTTTWRISNM